MGCAKITAMDLWVGSDAERFAAEAGPYLQERDEANPLATILAGIEDGRWATAIFALARDPVSRELRGAALRTPPHRLVITGEVGHAHSFIAAWLDQDPRPSGVIAAPETARACARALGELTGRRVRRNVTETLRRLTRVQHPRHPAPGHLRPGHWRERSQLAAWAREFAADAGITHAEGVENGVLYQLEVGRLHVWEHDARAVAMIGHNVAVAGAVRVGPVFTPAPLRGRGYATAMTAALSQALLDAGIARCLLYNDQANPVDTHIYASLGYEPIAEVEEHDVLWSED